MEDAPVKRDPLWRDAFLLFIVVFAATRLAGEVRAAWRTGEWTDLLVDFALLAGVSVAATAIRRASQRKPGTDDKAREL